MDIKSLVRDASKVHACLTVTAKGQMYASKACKIYIPVRFGERKLAHIGNTIYTTAVFAISVEDKFYAVSTVNSKMQLTPTSTNLVDIGGEEYYEFFFEKGSQITPNVDLVKDNQLAYKIYDELIAKGNIPWYISYEDLGKLFITAKEFANITLAGNNVPLEMIAAAIARDPDDRQKYYRHRIKSMADSKVVGPDYIPFRSVIYGATNTTAKLMGAYFDDGLMSALVNPSDKVEGVETLLRK